MQKISTHVGNTTLIRLNKIEEDYQLNNKLYIKMENTNPTGSIKDRPALNMILSYLNDGIIKKDSVLIEATSGNMGISLAALCQEFNIPCIIVMPFSASKERREIISSYNAKILLVEGGMEECTKKVNELLKEHPNYVWFNQFNNINNAKAHYLYTAKEIDDKLKDIDYIFVSFGSSGTISGISSYFKEKGYKTKIIGIEPYESPLLSKGYSHSHKIQGIGANFVPSIMQRDKIDEIILVKEDDALDMAKYLNKDGLDVGISTGANVKGVIDYLKKHKIENKIILTLAMDKGDRYSW